MNAKFATLVLASLLAMNIAHVRCGEDKEGGGILDIIGNALKGKSEEEATTVAAPVASNDIVSKLVSGPLKDAAKGIVDIAVDHAAEQSSIPGVFLNTAKNSFKKKVKNAIEEKSENFVADREKEKVEKDNQQGVEKKERKKRAIGNGYDGFEDQSYAEMRPQQPGFNQFQNLPQQAGFDQFQQPQGLNHFGHSQQPSGFDQLGHPQQQPGFDQLGHPQQQPGFDQLGHLQQPSGLDQPRHTQGQSSLRSVLRNKFQSITTNPLFIQKAQMAKNAIAQTRGYFSQKFGRGKQPMQQLQAYPVSADPSMINNGANSVNAGPPHFNDNQGGVQSTQHAFQPQAGLAY